jgi:hypothetical protein
MWIRPPVSICGRVLEGDVALRELMTDIVRRVDAGFPKPSRAGTDHVRVNRRAPWSRFRPEGGGS